MAQFPTNIEAISLALKRIRTMLHLTPVLTCSHIDKQYGRKFMFKSEHLQKTGSFKARGALNSVIDLISQHSNIPGVVTHSTGNHGQALAWAASEMNLPCSVVVPRDTTQVKLTSISGYGARLIKCNPTPTDRVNTCQKVAEETGQIIIPPYDYPHVIAGQGTVAVEFLEQVPDLDALVIAVSGGGLSSGMAIAAKSINSRVKIYLASPKGKMLEQCLKSSKRLWPSTPQFLDTIAEGIRTQQVGHLTFPVLCELAEKTVIEVSDEDMISAMKLVFHYMKQVIEPAAGAAVAAALTFPFPEDVKKVGVVVCGGNVDIDRLPWYSNG